MLEGSLDAHLHSTRSERDALKTWADARGVEFAYKNIHRLDDLLVIAEAVGTNEPPFVHIGCHGNHDEDDENRPYLLFAPKAKKQNRIYLDKDETIETFRRCFSDRAILLSACLVGKYAAQVDAFARGARLKYVAAFTRPLYDQEAILFDIALYHATLNLGLTFPAAVERAREAVFRLGIKGGIGHAQKLVKVFPLEA